MKLPYQRLERWIYLVNGAVGGFFIASFMTRNRLVTKWVSQSDISAFESLDDLLPTFFLALGLVCLVILVDVGYAVYLYSIKKQQTT